MTKKLAALIRDTYLGQPCCDCGGVYPEECYAFDHRIPEEKNHTIRQIKRWIDSPGNRLVMMTELSKTDRICHNCHATRTKKAREEGLINDGRPSKKGEEDE